MHNKAFHIFDFQKFRTNFKNLKDSVREFKLNVEEEKYMNRGKKIDWLNSKEKATLKKAIIDGEVTDIMEPHDVYDPCIMEFFTNLNIKISVSI